MSAITQILTALTDPPDPATDDSTTFANKAAAFTEALVQFGTEMNTLISQINLAMTNLGALNGVAFVYTFGSTTTDSDPGPGQLRLSSATHTAATRITLDPIDANGNNLASVLSTFDDSTSTLKGLLRLQHATDPTKFVIYSLTAYATPSGYVNFTVSGGVGSSASPFVAGDSVVLSFVPKGDKGDTGPAWTGGAVAGRAYTTPVDVAFSATPTFNTSLSNVFHLGALTGNVTSMTISNAAAGQAMNIRFVQDGTGGRTVTLPASVKAVGSVNAAANGVSWLNLIYVGTANGVAVNRWEGTWSGVPA